MRLTEEQVIQDDKRFASCNALAELLKYCGWEIPHRKSITNDEIRFHAWLCRSANVRLKDQEAEIRQLRLALDIAKGTCKGIESGGRSICRYANHAICDIKEQGEGEMKHDRYLEHAIACLNRAKDQAKDGVICELSVVEVDMILDLLKE